jgi:TonB family protein
VRFWHCLAASLAVHLVILVSLRVAAPSFALEQNAEETAPVQVTVLAEAPIIEEARPDEIPAGPIFAPSEEARAIRQGLGALNPEPVSRRPDEVPSPVRGPANAPHTYGSPVGAENTTEPSGPDPFDWSARDPVPGALAPSEAVGGTPDSGDTMRLTPDGPADTGDHAPPSTPATDAGTGSGTGGPDPSGSGPAPLAGGSGPAPTGEGDGRSGAGSGGGGPGGDGGGNPSGGGAGGTGGRKPARPPSHASGKEGQHTPPFPRSREMQRLEIHGTVRLRIQVDNAGDVTSATVAGASGYSEYDQQVAYWVQENWRYPSGHPGPRTVSVSF